MTFSFPQPQKVADGQEALALTPSPGRSVSLDIHRARVLTRDSITFVQSSEGGARRLRSRFASRSVRRPSPSVATSTLPPRETSRAMRGLRTLLCVSCPAHPAESRLTKKNNSSSSSSRR